jgi:hypothetical protein
MAALVDGDDACLVRRQVAAHLVRARAVPHADRRAEHVVVAVDPVHRHHGRLAGAAVAVRRPDPIGEAVVRGVVDRRPRVRGLARARAREENDDEHGDPPAHAIEVGRATREVDARVPNLDDERAE